MTNVFELGGVAATLVAAYQSNLLHALLNGYATPVMYAEELGLDPVATERVLAVLVTLGLANCEQGSYAASPDLQRMDALHLGGLDAVGALWSQVPVFLARGEHLANMDGSPAIREAAYSGVVSRLAEIFTDAARQLANELPGHPTYILDVGAGSGIWSLAMAERYPQARVVALDFPNVLQAFQTQAQHMGLIDRVEMLAGDFHVVGLPRARFDRILLANVLHLEPPDRAIALLRRVAAALAPGGMLIIVEMLGDGSLEGEQARTIYALHLALRTQQGKTHPLPDLRRWVEQAGLISGEVVTLRTPRGMAALVAHAPLPGRPPSRSSSQIHGRATGSDGGLGM